MEKAYLTLANGRTFEGARVGSRRDSKGEIVFTTSVVGYVETITDPCCAGHIVVQTFPLIGCYGVMKDDCVGRPVLAGYVVRELCGEPSNFRSEGTVESFLLENDIPGVSGVDTREIARIIRENGTMPAAITSEPIDATSLRGYAARGLVAAASCREKSVVPAEGEKKFSVTLVDFGDHRAMLHELTSCGAEVTIVPFDTSADEILASHPDGVVLSNGPGDPADLPQCAAQIARVIGRVPTYGVSLGHQLAAIAMGGKTKKMKFGHRGSSQPVRARGGERTFITSQYHGYVVDASSLAGVGEEIFTNANDGTNEGMEYRGKRCFTTQFMPERCEGATNTGFLFDRFIRMMGGEIDA